MIIGKSLTALGGGGLKPEIRVTAKAGALLNLHYKDSSIILQSYQLGAEETQHTFVVSVSETAYVVDDVTNSASVEVLVDIVAQYSVDIPYILYLYKDGDECMDVTGGWSDYDRNNAQRGYRTTNTISLANYSKMRCEFKYITHTDGSLQVYAGSFSSGDIPGDTGVVITTEWDISSYTESANIEILARQNTNGSVTFKRKKYNDHLYLYKKQLASDNYLVELEVYKLWLN